MHAAVPELVLSLKTVDDLQTNQLVASTPAMLEVVGFDTGNVQDVDFGELHDFKIEPRGSYQTITTINGVTKRSWHMTYRIWTEKTGEYVVGPARISTPKGIIVSNSIAVHVVAPEELRRQQKNVPFFVELEAKNKRIFIGQRTNLVLTLYARNDLVVESCSMPQSYRIGKNVYAWTESAQGIKKIDGISYRYVEWNSDVLFDEAGKIAIPGAHFACVTQKKSRASSMFGFIMPHFGMNRQEHDVVSSGLLIDVLPLPDKNRSIAAVGSFSELKMYVDTTRVREGEAFVLTLELGGAADVRLIDTFSLEVPEIGKVYPSKTEVTKNPDVAGGWVRTFEYIVQPKAAGSYTIPSQYFSFFDPEYEIYETLAAEGFEIEVIANVLTVKPAESTQQDVPSNVQSDQFSQDLNVYWIRFVGTKKVLSWQFFFLIFFLPIFVCLIYSIQIRWQVWKKRPYIVRSSFLEKIRKELQKDSVGAVLDLYQFVFELGASINKVSCNTLSFEEAGKYVADTLDLSEKEMQQWQTFLIDVAAFRYGMQQNIDQVVLLRQAREWTERLERVL